MKNQNQNQLENVKKIVINVKKQKQEITLRKAKKSDSEKISQFIANEAFVGSVLKRTPEEIAKLNYFIALCQNEIIGTIGYKFWPSDGVEIISLITKINFRKKGVGKSTLEFCLEEIKTLGIGKAFTLTIAPKLFKKMGFNPMSKIYLSDKAAHDCKQCQNGCFGILDPNCKEVALFIKL